MRISLCMIVRDEEAALERCLASARPLVDEICVVDTGSRDGTRAVAERCGAKRADVPWRDDFAQARNESLALAEGDWILVLDADEAIADPSARARLEAFAAGTRPSGARAPAERVGQVWIVNHAREGAGDETTRAPATRFFPNAPAYRFRGRVHEQLVRLADGSTADPERADTGLEVHHYGYTAEALRGKDKLARNLALLDRALEQDPDDPYLRYQLGRTHAVAGRHAEALAAFERALSSCPDHAPYGAHLVESAAYSLRGIGRSSQALDWLASVEADYADRADTCFLIALLAMDVGDLARAERGFRRCLSLAGGIPRGGESSPAASTFAPAFNLGAMHEVLGRTREAREWYERALAFHPSHAPSLAALARLGTP